MKIISVIDKNGFNWFCVPFEFRTANGSKVLLFNLSKESGESLSLLRYSHGEYYRLDDGFQNKFGVRSFFPSWDLRTLSRGRMYG